MGDCRRSLMEIQIVHFPHEINRLTVHVELRLSTIDCQRCLISIVCAFVFIFAHFFLLCLSQFVLCGRTTRMRQAHSTNSSAKNPKENPEITIFIDIANSQQKDRRHLPRKLLPFRFLPQRLHRKSTGHNLYRNSAKIVLCGSSGSTANRCHFLVRAKSDVVDILNAAVIAVGGNMEFI